jgi:hypothetical protein
VQVVDKPTHGNHIIDNFFTSHPDISRFDSFASLIKTKHQVVYVEFNCCAEMKIERPVCRKNLSYDLRPHNIDVLRYCLGSHDWGPIINCIDIQCAYDLFLETVKFFYTNVYTC